MGDLASEVVRHIVDYLRKRDAERTGWDDGGAFGAAADEIEGLGSLWGDLAASRTQNLTDTPDARNTAHDMDAVFALAESAIRQSRNAKGVGANLEWLRQVRLAQMAARAPVEDGGQRSREAAESTGIEGKVDHNPDVEVRVLHGPWRSGEDTYRIQWRSDCREPEIAYLDGDEWRLDSLSSSPILAAWILPEFARAVDHTAAQRDELDAIRARLRIECDELGDNTWPDDLHLADVIDRYLCRPMRDQIQALNEEIVHLRAHQRDVERGVVAEIVGWLRLRIPELPRSVECWGVLLAEGIERGDWRAQLQPKPGHEPSRCIAYTPTTNLYGEGEVTPVEACPHGVPYCWPCDECDAEVSTPTCPHGAPIGYGPGCAQCDADEVPCD